MKQINCLKFFVLLSRTFCAVKVWTGTCARDVKKKHIYVVKFNQRLSRSNYAEKTSKSNLKAFVDVFAFANNIQLIDLESGKNTLSQRTLNNKHVVVERIREVLIFKEPRSGFQTNLLWWRLWGILNQPALFHIGWCTKYIKQALYCLCLIYLTLVGLKNFCKC